MPDFPVQAHEVCRDTEPTNEHDHENGIEWILREEIEHGGLLINQK